MHIKPLLNVIKILILSKFLSKMVTFIIYFRGKMSGFVRLLACPYQNVSTLIFDRPNIEIYFAQLDQFLEHRRHR